MFDNEVTDMINAIRNITVGLFEHMEIMSKIDLDIRINYTEIILIGSALKNSDRSCW